MRMKFVNKLCGSEEISDKIREIVEPMEELKGSDLPLAIMTKYFKDEKTGKLIPNFSAGALYYPITIFNEPDEGDNMVYLAMKFNFFVYKNQGEEGTISKGHMFFPKTSLIINMNKEWENYEKGIPNKKPQITENTVELMIYGTQEYRSKEILKKISIAKEHQEEEMKKNSI